MKSLITLKVLLGLLTTVAIPAVVLTEITQTHFSVETQRKELARGSELVQGRVLESTDRSQRLMQNLSASNAINRPVDNIQPVRTCNRDFSFCPIPY